MRTIIVRHLDKVISEYSDKDIISNIEATNEWAKVEFVYKLTDTGRMLKIRFNTTEMATRALKDGLVVAYQRIPPRYIEKEIFVKLTPCYNCYSYSHKTQSCEIAKQSICAFCAKKGHSQNNCSESNPKCINCDGNHKTLASVCPVRKRLIKERSKDVRERSRSRSQARHVTYADMATHKPQQQQQQQHYFSPPTNVDGQNTRDLVSKIITSITFAHYLESFKPGSFQNTMDDMFKENNLPKVNFPTKLIGQEFRNLLNQTENNINEPQSSNTQVKVNNANNKTNKVDNDMESEYHNKRERESNSPVSSKKKREMERERERETEIVEEVVLHREATKTNPTNIAKSQSEREEIAPNHHPLPQRDPRLRAAAEKERERERRRREEEERRSKLEKEEDGYYHPITYANTETVDLHFYVRENDNIDNNSRNPHRNEQLKQAITDSRAKVQWCNPSFSYDDVLVAILTDHIDLDKVRFTTLPGAQVNAITNECCNE